MTQLTGPEFLEAADTAPVRAERLVLYGGRRVATAEGRSRDGDMRHLLRLADGATLVVRPLTAGDRDALDAAVARLSPTSRLLRFAAPKPRLTKADLDRLLDLDHHEREALVAVDPLTGEGVAVARYAAMPGEPGTAEIAVTVADAWQGRGLGAALTELVIARAREEGLGRLHAVAMGENRRAVRMLRSGGFTHVRTGGGLTEYGLAL